MSRHISTASLMSAFDSLIEAGVHLPPRRVAVLTVLALIVTGAVDALTGPVIWLGPLYILIICVPTWSLGERAGFVTGMACMAIGLSANGTHLFPTGALAAMWNMGMRVLTVAIIVMLVAGFRRSFDREWQCARTDPLTGALTKRGFLEEQARPGPACGWRALVYLDLDNFKEINDRDGHAEGDAVLRLLAEGVRETIRGRDRFVRVGGDEFLIALAVADEAEGRRAAASVHRRLNRLLQRHGDAGCSLGVLLIAPEGEEIGDAEIAAADRLMYEAKRAGGRGLRIGGDAEVPAVFLVPPVESLAESLIEPVAAVA